MIALQVSTFVDLLLGCNFSKLPWLLLTSLAVLLIRWAGHVRKPVC